VAGGLGEGGAEAEPRSFLGSRCPGVGAAVLHGMGRHAKAPPTVLDATTESRRAVRRGGPRRFQGNESDGDSAASIAILSRKNATSCGSLIIPNNRLMSNNLGCPWGRLRAMGVDVFSRIRRPNVARTNGPSSSRRRGLSRREMKKDEPRAG